MSTLFFLILLTSIALLIIGLSNPSFFKKFIKVVPKRKTVTLIFSSAIVLSFIGIGIFAPPVEQNKGFIKNEARKERESQPIEITHDTNTETTSRETVTNEEIKNEVKETAPQPEPTNETKNSKEQTAQYEYYDVSSVVDGDTVKINTNGTITTLRLIGMDTPETVDPRKEVQCFGKEASAKAKELLVGKKVRIEKDSTQDDLDKYGRTLVYIFREDGLFYNKYMIEQGYAHEYTYDTPYKYQAEFKMDQKSAQDNLRGLWSPNTCNGDTTQSANTIAVTSTIENDPIPVINVSTGKYYTSSHYTSKYYYPESCSGWQGLSESYLKSFDSLEALLKVYPNKTLSPSC
ncbi:MAG: thermonuclease family protein [Candidatus Magasanikiibacteriota bacterium]